MNFKKLDWHDETKFQKNMIDLGYNLLKIQYFYEEDQISKLSGLIHDHDTKASITLAYQDAGKETASYLETVTAFRNGESHLPKDQESFEWVMEYYLGKIKDLATFEISSHDDFIKWLFRPRLV